jgi:hypothetical protein
MRVSTGVGQIEEGMSFFPNKAKTALLYNFDVDDATVKDHHRKWLDKNIVSLLKPCKDLRVQMKGAASRTGAQDYNWLLSERRVEAVQKYLVSKGVDPKQIDLTWVGEEEAILKGEKKGTENPKDRAVFVKLPVPSGSRSPRFERPFPLDQDGNFVPPNPSTGEEAQLYLPAEGFRRLLYVVNAEGMTLRSPAPHVAAVVSPETNRRAEEVLITSDRELIKIEGWLPGSTKILAYDFDNANVAVGMLQPHVLGRQVVDVAFYYVKDAKHSTKRKPGEEAALLKVVNEIFPDQANVTVTQNGPARQLDFTQDLGDVVSEKTIGDDWHVLTNRVLRRARINVFFVWDCDFAAGDPGDECGISSDWLWVILDDDPKHTEQDAGVTLAHEVGHCLGLHHNMDKTQSDLLMWGYYKFDRGRRLAANERGIANSAAGWRPVS